MNKQITNEVVMIRPAKFYFNEETSIDNYYQNSSNENVCEIHKKALLEFDDLVTKIKNRGVKVNVIQDTLTPSTPDSIFPNNWFSSHEEGKLFFYPMFAENRREELHKFREHVYNICKKRNLEIIDYSLKVNDNIFLEGTGSIVLDRKNKKAYCSLSKRSNEELFYRFCKELDYKPIVFKAFQDGHPIYHTNVIMSIGEKRVIICLDSIKDNKEKEKLKKEFKENNKEIIDISLEQVKNFLGNTLELQGSDEKGFIVMSETAYNSLTDEQKNTILKDTDIVYSNVRTIEYYGGGSARCMIGEIF